MKRTVFGMATLLLLSATPCVVNAFTAIAWSESGQRGGSVKQAPTKEAAISAAIADCKKNGGGSDCQVFKVTDEPGFVALYASCAKTCGVTAVTGRATAEQARADGKRDCEAYYRNTCQLAQEWEEIPPRSSVDRNVVGLVVTSTVAPVSTVPVSDLEAKPANNPAGNVITFSSIKNYPDSSFGFGDRPAPTNKIEETEISKLLTNFQSEYNDSKECIFSGTLLVYNIASNYREGREGFSKSMPRALYWYRKAASVQFPTARCKSVSSLLDRYDVIKKLGTIFFLGEDGIKADMPWAAKYYEILAKDLHEADAYQRLCLIYASVDNPKQNLFLAEKMCNEALKEYKGKNPSEFKEAIKNYFIDISQLALDRGIDYFDGKNSQPKNNAEAMKYFCLSSKLGLDLSHFPCAIAWYLGDGGVIDKIEARRVILLASESNDANQLYRVYKFLRQEPAWKNDTDRILSKAADKGYPEAKALLGQK